MHPALIVSARCNKRLAAEAKLLSVSIWMNAHISATAILNRAVPGPTQLDADVVPTLSREADSLDKFPETTDWASQVKEIAYRYGTDGRPDRAQWDKDRALANEISSETLKRSQGEGQG